MDYETKIGSPVVEKRGRLIVTINGERKKFASREELNEYIRRLEGEDREVSSAPGTPAIDEERSTDRSFES